MPARILAAAKVRESLGLRAPEPLSALEWGRLEAGTRVKKPAALFPRVLPSESGPPSESAKVEAAAGRIPVADFAKVDLRVAEVLSAEPVPKSKKLLKLTVHAGETAPRTIVAGIAEHYAPADLVGKKVVIVANLLPATLMGIESNGMVLAASHEGAVSLLTLDKDVPSGSKVN